MSWCRCEISTLGAVLCVLVAGDVSLCCSPLCLWDAPLLLCCSPMPREEIFLKQGRTRLRPGRTMRSGSAASAAPNLGIPGNANTNSAGIARSRCARDIPSVPRGFLSWITGAGPRSTQTSPGWLPVISSSRCVRNCLGLLFHSGHQFFQTAES